MARYRLEDWHGANRWFLTPCAHPLLKQKSPNLRQGLSGKLGVRDKSVQRSPGIRPDDARERAPGLTGLEDRSVTTLAEYNKALVAVRFGGSYRTGSSSVVICEVCRSE